MPQSDRYSQSGYPRSYDPTRYQGNDYRPPRKKKKPFTLKRLWKRTKRFFVCVVRVLAKGIYRLVRAIATLPKKVQLIGGTVVASLLVLIIIVSSATANAAKKRAVMNTAEGLAALNAAAGAQTALSDSGIIDPYETYDASAAAALENESETPVTAAENDSIFTEMKEGDNGELVTVIQSRLMDLGYMDSDEPTDHYGPLTESALRKFQRHNELPDDGICGQSTYDLLMSENAKLYVMQRGDAGEDVQGVQTRLYELGYLDNKANITSTFGEKTEEAAKEFQKKNDLNADGKVGVRSTSILYGEDVVGKAYRLGDENTVIKDCQNALKKLGYITFKPDGVMGKSTVSAIRAFQQANGLTRDGCLGPATRDLLLSGDALPMVLQLGDYGSDVKNMQSYLSKLKYLKSANATGYFGEITEDAVKSFQKRNSLTSDGKVGGVTLSIMKSTKAKKAAAPPSSGNEGSSGGSSSGGSSSGGSSSGGSSSGGSSSNIPNKSGVDKLIALAESKIGCRYVSGAKGPNTFDCSGFAYWCMKNAGVSCSYQTSVMWRSCTRYQRITSIGSLQRGDILIFSGSTSSTGHVGIYTGGGKMIDASSSMGEVRVSGTVLKSGGYWAKHFLMAYRIF
ncbi:MAG: peptidoglycan-binding protein [Clostridia bacterium]